MLRAAIALVAVFFILLFCYTALRRLHYPFSYDQVEGSTVTSVWRIAHGSQIYVEPTPDFVPFLYAPLYFYIAAALGKMMEPGYAALRLLSTLATLGCLGVIFAFVYRETRRPLGALAAAGLYAACYHPLQAWFDVGRVDSLFVFLMLAAIYCTRYAPMPLAVLLWLLAIQTKQGALPIAFFVLCVEWRRRGRMVFGLLALGISTALTVHVINRATSGWYGYYLFGLGSGLQWAWRQAVFYVPVDLLLPLGFAFTIIAAASVFTPPAFRGERFQAYALLTLGIVGSVWYLRSHAGSAVNTLMPAYAWIAVLFGISFVRLDGRLQSASFVQSRASNYLLLGAVLAQLLVFSYNPNRYIPDSGTLANRMSFEEQLRNLPGDIFLIDHSYDALLAGKSPHADIGAFGLIVDAAPSPTRTALLEAFRTKIASRTIEGFVFDDLAENYDPEHRWMPSDFARIYPIRMLADGSEFYSRLPPQPEERWIYLQCSALYDANFRAHITPATVISYGGCANEHAATETMPATGVAKDE